MQGPKYFKVSSVRPVTFYYNVARLSQEQLVFVSRVSLDGLLIIYFVWGLTRYKNVTLEQNDM